MEKNTVASLAFLALCSVGCGKQNSGETTAVKLDSDRAGNMTVVTKEDADKPSAAPTQTADTGFRPALNDSLDTGESCAPLPVYFAKDSAVLDDEAKRHLDRIAGCLKRHELDTMTVAGRTDPSGTESYNEALGFERAKSVAMYLAALGVPNESIVVRSYGERGAEDSRIAWPTDRRVEMAVPPQKNARN
jgi:outer membrane protein OmpA-like peptidoglycan-associated protein